MVLWLLSVYLRISVSCPSCCYYSKVYWVYCTQDEFHYEGALHVLHGCKQMRKANVLFFGIKSQCMSLSIKM